MMRQFKHPNIVQIHSSFVFQLDVYVVTPVMCYGSCKDTYRNCFKSGFPEPIATLILRDLLQALDYLHRRHFIHRSVRASHILLEENRAVLTGFRDCVSLLVHGERVKRFHTLPENSGGGGGGGKSLVSSNFNSINRPRKMIDHVSIKN